MIWKAKVPTDLSSQTFFRAQCASLGVIVDGLTGSYLQSMDMAYAALADAQCRYAKPLLC